MMNRLEDLRTCVFILVSATAYLLDFGGNIAAGIEYFKFAHLHPANEWIPITFLTMILVAHILTALIFTFHLREPISTAFFFPLLQLHRLLRLFCSTLSLHGIKDLRLPEKNTFFSLMAAAVETAPHLQLQFAFLLIRFSEFRTSKAIWLSLSASFFSGTINGALAIDSIIAQQTPSVWHQLAMFIVAGVFTSSVLILGCLSFICVALWKVLILRISFLAVVPFIFLALYLVLWKQKETNDSRNGRLAQLSRFFRLLVFGYVSLTIGPIFPLAYHAKATNELGKPAYWLRLVTTTGLLFAYYLAVFVISFVGPSSSRWLFRCVEVFGVATWQPPCWFLVPAASIGLVVFILSMSCYIILDRFLESQSDYELESDFESTSSSSTHPLYPRRNVLIGDRVSTAPTSAIELENSARIGIQGCTDGDIDPSTAGNLLRSMTSGRTLDLGTRPTVRNAKSPEGSEVIVMQRSSSLPWPLVNCMKSYDIRESYEGHFQPLV